MERDYSKCKRTVARCQRQQSGCALSIWAGMGWAPRCWELHDHAREAASKSGPAPWICKACREVGALHCAHPDECGNMTLSSSPSSPKQE